MSSRFQDQTVTWFNQGEDEERLRDTPEVWRPPARSRLSNLMLVIATATLLASCALYLVMHGIPRLQNASQLVPLSIPVAK